MYVYIYMYIYIYVHIHVAYTFIYIYMYTHTCLYVYIHIHKKDIRAAPGLLKVLITILNCLNIVAVSTALILSAVQSVLALRPRTQGPPFLQLCCSRCFKAGRRDAWKGMEPLARDPAGL